ncbi:MAG: class I SAM-dependent methyltransferase [Candidatus Promineifilaceae bacterium]
MENNERIILDWGCGNRKHPNAIGMDNVKLEAVDIVHSLLDFPYPFADSSADEIILSHVLEHFHIDQINQILQEAYRILKDDGFVTVSVPHALTIAFATDPTHKTRFTFETLYYFTNQHAFSYYKGLDSLWHIKRYYLWGTLNIFNNNFVIVPTWKKKIEGSLANLFKVVSRKVSSITSLDMFVRYAPFWLVNIHCRLYKSNLLT